VAQNGDLFVGELTGFPFPVGGARVYRVPSTGGTPQVVAEGFTHIIDVAIDANGIGYVLEHDSDGLFPPVTGQVGRLIRVNPDGTRTVVAAGLVRPGGVAIGPDGAFYVSTRSTSVGTGEVVRIQP
jgi:glucose/arabinose dehydrogenase